MKALRITKAKVHNAKTGTKNLGFPVCGRQAVRINLDKDFFSD